MNFIKRAIISYLFPDTKNYQSTQVVSMGAAFNVEVLSPYGISTNAPKDSLILLFNLNGQQDNIIGIPYHPKKRFNNLKQGEIAVGNYLTKAKIYFKENGDIEIESKNDLNIKTSGKTTIDSTGDITINSSGKIEMTSTGVVNINGSSEPLIKGNAFETLYNAHTHPVVSVGSPTGAPVVPMSAGQKSTKNFIG